MLLLKYFRQNSSYLKVHMLLTKQAKIQTVLFL